MIPPWLRGRHRGWLTVAMAMIVVVRSPGTTGRFVAGRGTRDRRAVQHQHRHAHRPLTRHQSHHRRRRDRRPRLRRVARRRRRWLSLSLLLLMLLLLLPLRRGRCCRCRRRRRHRDVGVYYVAPVRRPARRRRRTDVDRRSGRLGCRAVMLARWPASSPSSYVVRAGVARLAASSSARRGRLLKRTHYRHHASQLLAKPLATPPRRSLPRGGCFVPTGLSYLSRARAVSPPAFILVVCMCDVCVCLCFASTCAPT